jgi:hypothetical protein
VSSDRRTRITKDSESVTSRRALSRHKACTVEDRTVGLSIRRYSVRWALSRCVDRHRRKELFEF